MISDYLSKHEIIGGTKKIGSGIKPQFGGVASSRTIGAVS
jgi:hypothetical protein